MENNDLERKIHMLRAVMKMSVAINDLDEIEYEKLYFRHDFKVKAKRWSAIFQTFTAKLMKSLVDIDSTLLEEVYKSFEDNGISVKHNGKNWHKQRSLLMLYIKLVSAINDLERIESMNEIFPAPILYKFTTELVECMNKQYSFIKDLTDNSGKGVDSLIAYYDEIGEKILHKGESSN